MTTWHAVLLGVIQGITEFLPISSTGHLVLAQKLFGISDANLQFVTCLHLGTLVAVIWALRQDVMWLVRHPFSRRVWLLVVALIPTVVIGALFADLVDEMLQNGVTIGLEFAITGAILWWMDCLPQGNVQEDQMSWLDALWIGLCQSAALMPALSRSGLTIAGGLWRGLDREAAGRFSFVLSIPAILGAVVMELEGDAGSATGGPSAHWMAMLIGTGAALVSGYAAVHGTLWLLKRSKMRVFAVYVWLVAAFILCDQVLWHRWFPPFHG
ncbi:MAG: undecaprenyl-diphosphate phosphatase [Alicyclobacillus sp.]|nr:undecaprenyl-diphosphate phosphatase [Alicyclobacillus sp.]